MTTSPPLRAGQSFHGLLVHSPLGEGAMGYTFLASHPVLEAPVVLKLFKSRDAANVLLEEARLAVRAPSPHVVPVLDAGTDAGLAFIVQRYVDGIDLGELIQCWYHAGRRVPLGVATRLIEHIARGLESIHLAGVVHRDVKPANLFLQGDGTAVIGDFGVALAAGDALAGPAGTPLYMAPEQWHDGPIDGRVDLYALGIVAHLLATGKRPPRALRPDPPDPAPPLDPRMAYLQALVDRLTQPDPDARYPSAGALARDLSPLAEPPPSFISVAPDTWRIGRLTLELHVGDLAATPADVIVNAANSELQMAVGVARALRLAGGDTIQQEALAHAPVKMGDVVWTGAGYLSARWVAHAVAAYGGAICLARSTLRVLLGAETRAAQVLAFPALGTGVARVPMSLAAKLMLEALRTFASLHPEHVKLIRVVLLDASAADPWRSVLRAMSS